MLYKTLFWIFVGLLAYSYVGYTILLLAIKQIKAILLKKHKDVTYNEIPDITIVVAAYNEENNIAEKIKNTIEQDYPTEKLQQLWVNDGSTDGTRELLMSNINIKTIDQLPRQGKVAAINLAMQHVKTDIVVFSDANAIFSKQAISKLIQPFTNPRVGCVAGEKRIYSSKKDSAVSGEGAYWQYESLIKKLESYCGSTLSATG